VRQAKAIRARQRLGKYKIERKLAQGGFADVYRAYDTIEGIRVALKIPQAALLSEALLADFKSEVRVTGRLDHPNILPIKNADFIDGRFVVVYPLGDSNLAERLRRRLSLAKALDFAEQILEALAHAHAHRVLHCDVKPENFILFEDHLRLGDFGISKIAFRTMQASGSGTIGFMAPEQAMGRPSLRSDVFAAGLVLYRMFAGTLPAWPFEWPPAGFERARRRLHPDLLALLRRSMRLDPKQRFRDAQHMLDALVAVRARSLAFGRSGSRRKTTSKPDWRQLQLRQFNRDHKQALEARHTCKKCSRPVAESMRACPWCGASRKILRDETRFPARCVRCRRGLKLDWRFCPWCYGKSVGPKSERKYTDRRYSARCANRACSRRDLMPFMRYCPWCRTKVKRPWPIPNKTDRCSSCRWGVLNDYWSHCPWCTRQLDPRRKTHGR